MARSFFAVPISKETLSSVSPVLEELKRTLGENVVWKNPLDWHITLRFLGEINHDQQGTLAQAARQIAHETKAGVLHVKKLAPFPLPASRHIALHIVPNAALKSVSDKLEGVALAVGLPKDNRRFRPHITLGKFSNEISRIAPITVNHFDIPFEELVLYASQPGSNGQHYRVLQRFTLERGGE